MRLVSGPMIVCLCGSMKFHEEMLAAAADITLNGSIVLAPFVVDFDDVQKSRLDELHLRKIDLADEVHVINVDGYVGDSTRREIAYAVWKNKRVTFAEDDEYLESNAEALGQLIAEMAMADI